MGGSEASHDLDEGQHGHAQDPHHGWWVGRPT
jgi:hypothetical protein